MVQSNSAYDQQVKNLTHSDILNEFPDVTPLADTKDLTSSRPSSAEAEDPSLFQGQDAEQIKLMEEVCIVIDYNDVPVGAGSKKTCKY